MATLVMITKQILVLLFVLLCISAAFAQGTFTNLNFASANIPPGTEGGSFTPISDALPGWTGYFGGTQESSVLYNSLSTGSVELALLGPDSPISGIPGNTYTAVLQAGLGGPGGPSSASIAQTGLVPSGTESLLFTASAPYGAGWSVMVGGQNISVFAQGQQGGYYTFAGDVSAFAGLQESLQFTANIGAGPTVNLYLDNIMFSSNPAPEPGTWTLLLCGAGALGILRQRRKR